MQTRRKVSASTRRMIQAPSGTPTIRLGTISGASASASRVKSPAYQYAAAVSAASATRTKPSAARNSRLSSPWLLRKSASGGPEIVVRA